MRDIDIKMRRCLKCLKDLRSQGPGNRICKTCSQEHRRLFKGISESSLQSQRGRKYHNGELLLAGDLLDS